MSDQPVGPEVDAHSAQRPGSVTLEGQHAVLAALDPARHGAALRDAVRGDDALWTYMDYGPFDDDVAFDAWLAARAGVSDPFAYAVLERSSGLCLGVVTLMAIRPAMRVIEMGGIVYSAGLQRTPAATEAQYLAAAYVFETLGYRRYEWKCNALNASSRRAALRLGFTFEGVFRQHMIVKGRNRDTAWFSMLDSEWPVRKRAFERWLDSSNFDSAGRQRVALGNFMNAG